MMRFKRAPAVFLVVLVLLASGCGLLALLRVINLVGTWDGNWSSVSSLSGTFVAVLNQSQTTLIGTITVSGSPCFTTGSVSGTITGNNVAIGAAFGGGQTVNYNATVNQAGTQGNGTYTVSGGACNGDSGTFTMTKR